MLDAAERMTDAEWDAMVAWDERMIAYHNAHVDEFIAAWPTLVLVLGPAEGGDR